MTTKLFGDMERGDVFVCGGGDADRRFYKVNDFQAVQISRPTRRHAFLDTLPVTFLVADEHIELHDAPTEIERAALLLLYRYTRIHHIALFEWIDQMAQDANECRGLDQFILSQEICVNVGGEEVPLMEAMDDMGFIYPRFLHDHIRSASSAIWRREQTGEKPALRALRMAYLSDQLALQLGDSVRLYRVQGRPAISKAHRLAALDSTIINTLSDVTTAVIHFYNGMLHVENLDD